MVKYRKLNQEALSCPNCARQGFISGNTFHPRMMINPPKPIPRALDSLFCKMYSKANREKQ